MTQLIVVAEHGLMIFITERSAEHVAAQIKSGSWPAGCGAENFTGSSRWSCHSLGASTLLVLPEGQPGVSPGLSGSAALSPRQAQIFSLLGKGLKTLEIARRLGISPRTVYYHTAQLRRRLGTAAASRDLPILFRSQDL